MGMGGECGSLPTGKLPASRASLLGSCSASKSDPYPPVNLEAEGEKISHFEGIESENKRQRVQLGQ